MTVTSELADIIINEGWFAPSVRPESTDDGDALRARWLPIWAEPRLKTLLATERCASASLSDVEDQVDRLVRERLSDATKAEAFRSLDPRYGVPHTPLEKWVHALLVDEERPPELPDWLEEDVAEWHRELELELRSAPYRVGFVLIEPAAEDGKWFLAYGLQATDDPRHWVPGRDVWRREEADPTFEGRVFAAAQERLSEGLSIAAERYAPLSRATAERDFVPVSLEEAVDLLESGAAMLEAVGFAVLLPPWWEDASPFEAAVTYGMKERTISPANAGTLEPSDTPVRIGFDTLMTYRKELMLQGAPISEDDWRRLSERDAPLLFFGGRWARLGKNERRAADRFFRETRDGQLTAAEAMRAALTIDASATAEGTVPIRRWQADAPFARLIGRLKQAAVETLLDAPPTLQGELRDYQQRGYSWLVRMRELGFGVCLADDMGLGKTVQWIAYALHTIEHMPTEERRPLLLLCPTSVLGNWQRELERFAPSLAVYFHYGADRAKGEKLRKLAAAHDVTLTSYSTALRDRRSIGGMRWSAITLDEAQYVKNSNAQLTKFIRTLEADHRIAMTGTPVENKLSDLWSIFEFMNPGFLGGERGFRRMFGDGAERTEGDATNGRLQRLVQPFLLRRLKTDERVIRDLPEKIEQTSYCGLTARQAALYTATLERMETQLRQSDGMRRRGVILSAITRLKQICNAPEQALREGTLQSGASGKLIRLEELLQEAVEFDRRSIVFTQYASMVQLLRPYLERRLGCEVGAMTGQTPRKDRERLVERFQQEEDGPRVLVLSLKTGGFGLNLTRATRLIHYDRWWNPAAERQATDRAYRIGQTRTVEVWKLVTKGTLEESIEKLLEHKERLADGVVGTGERWITEYDDEQLSELLSLRRQMILEEE
ncbi:DEAD/DEAH box helicase [Paenibacillus sp. TRM 82003]|nr:DEAD/DEAH box helicase [Paenibacillus sp. TRM 82003]